MNSGNQPFYVLIGRMELPYYIRGKEKVEFGGNTLAQPFWDLNKCKASILNREVVWRMKYSGIGGQAVIEGVMMKNGDEYATAVRKPDGTIEVKKR